MVKYILVIVLSLCVSLTANAKSHKDKGKPHKSHSDSVQQHLEDKDHKNHGYKNKKHKQKDRPYGWDQGKKTGWGDDDVPPGQAKKLDNDKSKQKGFWRSLFNKD